VVQGESTTVPVTLEQMAYHVRAVARANTRCWIVGDLPYGSYHESPEQALRSSVALMQAGAHMVKLEGGGWTNETVRFLVERGVPVCGHLGLTPQSVHALGGYRIQGRTDDSAALLKQHAREQSDAGAAMAVLELVPSTVAKEITQACAMATIGIGAGPDCAGQVLVLHDMLGVTHGKLPRFVRNFMEGSTSIAEAVGRYVTDVKSRAFPDATLHGY
jgi:3-methyl-2-oxobutanoate hydroxymethyltransferase